MASQTYYQRDNQAGTLATVEYDGNRFGVQYFCGNKDALFGVDVPAMFRVTILVINLFILGLHYFRNRYFRHYTCSGF